MSQELETENGASERWVRCRFKADAHDYRPVIWPPPGPCWCTGYAGDDSYSTVVAYLRPDQDVHQWWPEAEDIDTEEVESIKFTDRFPVPDWWDEEKEEFK